MTTTPLTVVGNLTSDPELRFTPNGVAVANFTIASTPKRFNKTTNQYEDGETLFMRCTAWKDAAENAAESLHRGDRVLATGNLVSRSWETKEGEKRTVSEMQVTEVGPSLRWATAKVTKRERTNGPATPAPSQTAQADPWATTTPSTGGGWSDAAKYDGVPF